MTDGERGQARDTFDPTLLKSLDHPRLVDTLIEDALTTTELLPDGARDFAKAQIEDMYWVPSGAEEVAAREQIARKKEVAAEVAAAFLNAASDEHLEPDEVLERYRHQKKNAALEKVGRYKEEVEAGLASGRGTEGEPWTEGSTLHGLIDTCEAQKEAGITLEADFVRETAMSALPSPGYRGIALLQNALGGDAASRDLGIEALREGVEQANLGWDGAFDGLKLIAQFLRGSDVKSGQELKDMAIDVLAYLRGWRGISHDFASYTREYALITAEVAAAMRDAFARPV